MRLETGDFISLYVGDCSPNRDKTKDKYSVRFYQVVDIISDPSGGKPTLKVEKVSNEEIERTIKYHWLSDVHKHYNIVYHSGGQTAMG